jgi:hypothetical protein
VPSDPLAPLMARFLAEADRLGRRALASGNYQAWARDFQQQLIDYHLASYFLGKSAAQLSPEAERILTRLIDQQLAYVKKFGGAAGDLSDAMFLARSSLYAGALKATYYRAKYSDWVLPFVPTEKCECMVNCTCMIRVDDLGGGRGLMYWILGDNEHCPTCLNRKADSPFRVRRAADVSQTHPGARHSAPAGQKPADDRAAHHARG